MFTSVVNVRHCTFAWMSYSTQFKHKIKKIFTIFWTPDRCRVALLSAGRFRGGGVLDRTLRDFLASGLLKQWPDGGPKMLWQIK
jgi:hypothetical protein